MASYLQQARERAMKVEEVILRAVSGQITFWQAARILRMSPRHLRRVLQRYRQSGFDGLLLDFITMSVPSTRVAHGCRTTMGSGARSRRNIPEVSGSAGAKRGWQ